MFFIFVDFLFYFISHYILTLKNINHCFKISSPEFSELRQTHTTSSIMVYFCFVFLNLYTKRSDLQIWVIFFRTYLKGRPLKNKKKNCFWSHEFLALKYAIKYLAIKNKYEISKFNLDCGTNLFSNIFNILKDV